MNIPPRERWTACRFAELGAFVVVVALFQLVSAKAGMRGLGFMGVAGALLQLKNGSIAYGWEGHEASGQIRGVPAVVLSTILGLVGVAMLVWPSFFLALFGWSEG